MTQRPAAPDNLKMAYLEAVRDKAVRRAGVAARLFDSVRGVGTAESARKIARKLRLIYRTWLREPSGRLSGRERARQRGTAFHHDRLVSILVPAFNTSPPFLRDLIGSVRAQTYENWELCFADGSDAGHTQTGAEIRAWAQKDKRVRYLKLERNLGISENTNACLDMARGDCLALLDHDDMLHPAALYEVMRAIDGGADFVYTDEGKFRKRPRFMYQPHYKPDFAPDTLRANNYICHFTAFTRELQRRAGRYRPDCDGSQDYDMVLRLTERAKKIVHIPKVLYYWRAHAGSVSENMGSKPYAIEAGKKALRDHLKRLGLEGEARELYESPLFRVAYRLSGTPKVSVFVYGAEDDAALERCLRSVLGKTSYPDFELIVDAGGGTPVFPRPKDPRVRFVSGPEGNGPFGRCGDEVGRAAGAHVVLLDGNCEVITPGWLEEMLMYSQREDVGAVGAALYYPDGSVRHAGIACGIRGSAGRLHHRFPLGHAGYMTRLAYVQNLSAVSPECLMMKRSLYIETGGADAAYAAEFAGIDLCLRLRRAGSLVVFTPFAELYRHGSCPEGAERVKRDAALFGRRWAAEITAGDPYYNPNLTLDREDLSIRFGKRRTSHP